MRVERIEKKEFQFQPITFKIIFETERELRQYFCIVDNINDDLNKLILDQELKLNDRDTWLDTLYKVLNDQLSLIKV